MTDARRIFGKAPTMRLPGGGGAGEGWWGWGDYGVYGFPLKQQTYYFAVWCDTTPDITPAGFYLTVMSAGTSAWFVKADWDGTTALGDLGLWFNDRPQLGAGILVHQIDPSIAIWNRTGT